jgi:hypothetical protein
MIRLYYAKLGAMVKAVELVPDNYEVLMEKNLKLNPELKTG